MTLTGRTLLGRYYLRELIDSGGMSDVYLAWDQQRSVRLAIKVLRRDLMQNSNIIQLFQREAVILRQLEHPNIVRLYEFEQDGEAAFFVMDWVEGKNLAQLIQERHGPLSLAETARILAPVCSALHFAHRSKIYHCDVKPANIMLHDDGRILLSDFGVARLAGDDVNGGTPPYMAPEQFEDLPVDARADVYGLGVTVYEMLAGKQPFRGDSANSKGSTLRDRIAWEHRYLPVPPLHEANPRIPPQVERVVAKAMSKQVDQRFPTIIAFREAFEQASGSAQENKSTFDRTVFGKAPIPASRQSQPPAQMGGRPAAPPTPEARQKYIEPMRGNGPHLFCRQGTLAGRSVSIPPEGLTIGRGSQCQLRINEASVSRKHATIERGRRGLLYLRDEGSSLGTYVNGVKIVSMVLLKSGDTIQVGRYEVFELREA